MKKRAAQIIIASLLVHISSGLTSAQGLRLPSPTPTPARTSEPTSPILIPTSNQGTIDLTDPSVGVVIRNEGGDITIGVIDDVPPPAPTTAPTSPVIQNPTTVPFPTSIVPTAGSALNPTQPVSEPTSFQTIPSSSPRTTTVPTPIITQDSGVITNPTNQPEPTGSSSIDIPTSTPIVIRSATPTTPPLVRVTPTPLPLPTPTDTPTIFSPVIDPIIDIIDSIFGSDRTNEPPTTTTTIPTNPTISEPQPEFVLVSPTPTSAPLVRVTPTPFPLPTQASEPTILSPVIDPIIDIIDGIFGNNKDVPTTTVDPVTGEAQPEYVLISPTPTPAPIPVIGGAIEALNDFLSGNVSTTSLTEEQKAILADSFVSDKPSEIQDLFVRASDLISPQVSALLGINPGSNNQLPATSEQIVESYLANYQLKVVADHEGNVVVQRGDASVKIPVPIIVNPQNRSFSVLTENGTIPVTYYPDTIKDELELNRLINDDLDMTLGLKNSELVYVAQGCETEFMFAFLPVCPQKQIVISAQDMNIHEIRQSTISRVVDTLSI